MPLLAARVKIKKIKIFRNISHQGISLVKSLEGLDNSALFWSKVHWRTDLDKNGEAIESVII